MTTTVDDCLALCFGGFDGGDGYPFTVTGTGWSKEDDGRSGTSGWSDASGAWGKKSMGAAGSTLDATIGASATDGMVGVQIAIAPSAAPPPKVTQYLAGNDCPEFPHNMNVDSDKLPCPPPYD